MGVGEAVRKIEASRRRQVALEVVDLLLKSGKGRELPSHLGRDLLLYHSRGQLDSEEGLTMLLEAAVAMEREGVIALLEGAALTEAASTLKA